ncbi:pantoate--beta-alanine ligase [Rhizomicrobium palustre]|uniref:Pantothenate synthetase n=1 Tax=Rhizomicrobium palustre TaxID=189966 RepID=A0A846N2J7_9PROT|nr:pantoate--beta-alanine ligase [Rhizomicrobium palustre]NIK90224.1 pantoate--beta-alanine ligase [Rhizomicrobium palustre]
MSNAPQIVTTVAELRHRIKALRQDGAKIGLVPTMGALHAGHLSLTRQITNHADVVVVSIFVNPTQFAPHEDFDRYPRTLMADAEKLGASGETDLIFAPQVTELYPNGFATRVEVKGPALGLEADVRPHFFSGVTTVVSKLLIAAMPDVAMFGEKDYQQLLVVRRMVEDLGLNIRILGAPIVRERDGLAMSSRNAYLSENERKIAGQLNVILQNLIAKVRDGMPIADAEESGKAAVLEAGFNSVDYLTLRDAETLAPLSSLERPARVLVAATVGSTRLLDNMAV